MVEMFRMESLHGDAGGATSVEKGMLQGCWTSESALGFSMVTVVELLLDILWEQRRMHVESSKFGSAQDPRRDEESKGYRYD